jgi:hypothetical protein
MRGYIVSGEGGRLDRIRWRPADGRFGPSLTSFFFVQKKGGNKGNWTTDHTDLTDEGRGFRCSELKRLLRKVEGANSKVNGSEISLRDARRWYGICGVAERRKRERPWLSCVNSKTLSIL